MKPINPFWEQISSMHSCKGKDVDSYLNIKFLLRKCNSDEASLILFQSYRNRKPRTAKSLAAYYEHMWLQKISVTCINLS